jgi:hypothetical protein
VVILDVARRRSSNAPGVRLGGSTVSLVQVMSINEAGAGRFVDGASRTRLCVVAGEGSRCRRLQRYCLGNDGGLVGFEGSRLAVTQSRQRYVGIDRRPNPFFRRDGLRGLLILIVLGRAPVNVPRGPTLLGLVNGFRSRESGGLEGEHSGEDQMSGGKHDGGWSRCVEKSLIKSSRCGGLVF